MRTFQAFRWLIAHSTVARSRLTLWWYARCLAVSSPPGGLSCTDRAGALVAAVADHARAAGGVVACPAVSVDLSGSRHRVCSGRRVLAHRPLSTVTRRDIREDRITLNDPLGTRQHRTSSVRRPRMGRARGNIDVDPEEVRRIVPLLDPGEAVPRPSRVCLTPSVGAVVVEKVDVRTGLR